MFIRFLIACLAILVVFLNAHPLDDYVRQFDPAYGWVEYGDSWRVDKFGITAYTLNMTSLRWLTDDEFTADSPAKSLWWHWLIVIVPDVIEQKDNALLYITGGGQGNAPADIYDEDIAVTVALAATTGTIAAALFMIPNEHTIFTSDPIKKSRTEDSIIAYTWDHFIAHPDQPEWLVRFPMVKSSVRAMDAVTEFINQKHPELGMDIQHFAVAGASKRGWTTWLVGAVDQPRVNNIMPLVLDAINFQKVEHHQFQSYGGWSYALQDYLDMNIMARIDDPGMTLLSQMEDPYFFKDRLATIPKLVVNAVWDEFQQPDDTHYWWNDMPGQKHFMMTPNAEHSLATGILEVVPSIVGYQHYRMNNLPTPSFTWTIDKTTGEIVATLDKNGEVYEANVWYGYSCGKNTFDGKLRRDWRVGFPDNVDPNNAMQCASGCGLYSAGDEFCANLKSVFQKQPLNMTMSGIHRTYSARIEPPQDGRYVAYFIEITYRKPKTPTPPTPPAVSSTKAAQAVDRGFDFSALGVQKYGPGLIPKDIYCRMVVTTEVSIFPDTFPYEGCKDESCDGPIV